MEPSNESKNEDLSHDLDELWCYVRQKIFPLDSPLANIRSAGITTIARFPYISAIVEHKDFFRKSIHSYHW